MSLPQFREQLATYFNKNELMTICFDLTIHYDDLPGETLSDKTRELLVYCQRHGRLTHLVTRCRELRPEVVWADTGDDTAAPPPPAGHYRVKRVFGAPNYYAAAGVQLSLIHPTLLDQIKTELGARLKQEAQIVEVKWESDETAVKELIGPFTIKNPRNGRSLTTYLCSIEPDYSRAMRKNSISLLQRDKVYLDVDEGKSAVDIVVGRGTITTKTLQLLAAPDWFEVDDPELDELYDENDDEEENEE